GQRLDLDLQLSLVVFVPVQGDIVEGFPEGRNHLAVELDVGATCAGARVDPLRFDELARRRHGPDCEVAVFEMAWELHPDHACKRPLPWGGGIVSDFWVR